jgi:hypothetical protein
MSKRNIGTVLIGAAILVGCLAALRWIQPQPSVQDPEAFEVSAYMIESPLTATTTEPPRQAPEGSSCGEWFDLAMTVGWDEQEWQVLDRVLYRESRCLAGVHNPHDPAGGSFGLTQVNGYWCSPSRYTEVGWLQDNGVLRSCSDLYRPELNLAAALAIWNYDVARGGCGWRAWAYLSCPVRIASEQP